jgi:hypothetical protein
MSTTPTLIEATIVALENATPPKIKRFEPRLRGGESAIRRITIITHIHEWMHNTTAKHQDLRAAVRAHLGRFVKGEEIDDYRFMKRVSRRGISGDDFSDEVWSVRPNFQPKHRFFGGFILPDWLLITNYRRRDYLNSDQRWHVEIGKAQSVWNAVMPSITMVKGAKLSDYITDNAEHEDDRWDEA